MTAEVILLVEDEYGIGQLISHYLQDEGYVVVWVRSGEEALVEVGRHAVRLIVLDVGLPGIDGFEVLRRLRATSALPHGPRALSTAAARRRVGV